MSNKLSRFKRKKAGLITAGIIVLGFGAATVFSEMSVGGSTGKEQFFSTLFSKTEEHELQNVDVGSLSDIAQNVLAQSSDTSLYTGTLEIPEYDGKNPIIYVNSNVPFFTESEKETSEVFENYSDLDELGRCGVAYANICKDIMPTTDREEKLETKPSGWHNQKYEGLVENDWIYNRCHLIAFCLAGENDNEKNLITGTRYFNANLMLEFEDDVLYYVDATDNHVLYRVTPYYREENDLVADGCLMEAYSVEDDGELQFCVYCYNVQPGFVIDYKTGYTALIEDYSGEYVTESRDFE